MSVEPETGVKIYVYTLWTDYLIENTMQQTQIE